MMRGLIDDLEGGQASQTVRFAPTGATSRP